MEGSPWCFQMPLKRLCHDVDNCRIHTINSNRCEDIDSCTFTRQAHGYMYIARRTTAGKRGAPHRRQFDLDTGANGLFVSPSTYELPTSGNKSQFSRPVLEVNVVHACEPLCRSISRRVMLEQTHTLRVARRNLKLQATTLSTMTFVGHISTSTVCISPGRSSCTFDER